jgi:hypothetical protein
MKAADFRPRRPFPFTRLGIVDPEASVRQENK